MKLASWRKVFLPSLLTLAFGVSDFSSVRYNEETPIHLCFLFSGFSRQTSSLLCSFILRSELDVWYVRMTSYMIRFFWIILEPEGDQNMPPQICHFGIRIILSRRQLRINRCKRSSLLSPMCLKAGSRFLLWRWHRLSSTSYSVMRTATLVTGDRESPRWVCINKPC